MADKGGAKCQEKMVRVLRKERRERVQEPVDEVAKDKARARVAVRVLVAAVDNRSSRNNHSNLNK